MFLHPQQLVAVPHLRFCLEEQAAGLIGVADRVDSRRLCSLMLNSYPLRQFKRWNYHHSISRHSFVFVVHLLFLARLGRNSIYRDSIRHLPHATTTVALDTLKLIAL